MIVHGIASLWRGEPRLSTIFWEYTIGWGTLFNLVCTGAALALVLNGYAVIAIIVHFVAMPFNAFLVVAVFRAAAREHTSSLAGFSRVGVVIWFILMLVV
jgi:hypothetical protein